MSSQLKPIKLWGAAGPNPPKVAMFLEELGVPYDTIPIDFAGVKQPEYLAVNPNGRMPAIHDPNFGADGLTLWESGAILEYIAGRYDTEHRLSFPAGSAEAELARQWLFFQVSGQGPYYGQAVWFSKYHPERLPSAVERYLKEADRVTGVLEGHLAKQTKDNDGPWLVGGKMSYADVAWIMWQVMLPHAAGTDGPFDPSKYPLVQGWIDRMTARPAIKKILEKAFAQH